MIIDLRKFAESWVARALLGVIVVSFVITFGYGSLQTNKEVVAKVGDYEILSNQFNRAYQEQIESLRQRFPDNADVLAQQLNLRERVMDELVNRRLLLRAADDMGFRVSESELRDAISGMSGFQVAGKFDFETYKAILRQNNMTPEAFEERRREDLLVQKVQRAMVAGVIVSPAEVDQRYRIESEAVEVDYVFVDPAKFNKAVKSDPDAVKAYYEKNTQDFLQPAQYKVRYFTLGLGQLEKDAEVQPRLVERYYERNLEAEFTTPKRVRASQIMKRLAPNAPEAEAQAKRTELQLALAAARAGQDFTGLVKKYSDDKATKDGDLGLFRKEEMPAEVADTAFTMQPGQISNIIRSPFGLHVIKVTAVQPEVRKPLEAVRKQIEEKLRAERAERKLDLEADRLPQRVQKDGMDPVAQEFKVRVLQSGWIDGTQPLPEVGPSAEIYGRVKGRRVNDVGVMKRNPTQGHVFFQVTEVKDAFTKPLADVRAQVEAKVAENQRRDAALAEAKAAFPKLKGPNDLASYAKTEALPVKTVSVTAMNSNIAGIGANREFQQAAFRLTAAQPYALSIRNNQVHLLHLKRRYFPKPEQEKDTKARLAQQMEQEWKQYFLTTALQQLREKTGVKILIPELLTTPGPAPQERRG
ncbi:MAG TPA: SurA N-terminal domain-containing protein [bacterium]